ncbi:hypothetical protein OS493_011697 [Desmophyllum pertusum]|uniref:Uncharacterized protein n=1 Tax=Desmophyllum pertusum TaxID=174260 RepID=A0A9W9YDW3_9CNID|nr:hypothetical protein OS493_011697 [Desmophyllum pertusum]
MEALAMQPANQRRFTDAGSKELSVENEGILRQESSLQAKHKADCKTWHTRLSSSNRENIETILALFSPPQPRIHFSLNLSSFHPDQPDAHQNAQLRPRL